MLDLRDYLIDRYSGRPMKGKPAEISIDCPSCGKGEFHFSFNVVKREGNCFHCPYLVNSGERLLQDLEGITQVQAKILLSTGSLEGTRASAALHILNSKERFSQGTDPDELHKNADLPEGFTLMVNPNRVPVMRVPVQFSSRGYSVRTLQNMQIGFCASGSYSGRIIFPIMCGRLKSFYARRIYDWMEPKYKNPPGSKHSQLLYNYDNIPSQCDLVCVVEGCTDVLRLTDYGMFAVATSGKKISSEQISLLVSKEPKEVVALFDGDAYVENQKSFEKLSYRLNAFMAYLPKKGVVKNKTEYYDPDDCPKELLNQVISNRIGMSRIATATRILKNF